MSRSTDLTVRITGMHCASCVQSVETGVSDLTGVESCQVNLALNSARISFDQSRVTTEAILERVKNLGYEASVGQSDIFESNTQAVQLARDRFLWALITVFPLLVLAMVPMVTGQAIIGLLPDALLQAIAAGIAIFYAGRSILSDALVQLRHGRANMNTLIAMGAIVAYGWSSWAISRINLGQQEALYFESAGMIVAIVLLGRFLEARSKGRAGESIRALWGLRPESAVAVINNTDVEVPIDSIRTGMSVRVLPGQRVPADGRIGEGDGTVDESMLTGESVPVEKKPGDMLLGGSLNGTNPFLMEVVASGAESYLATVVRLVSEAQANKAPVQRMADRVASVFVPAVLLLAALTGITWYFLGGDWSFIVRTVVSVLIIACPCALGLATPTAVLAGTGRGARDGIVIRGGDILERVATLDTVIFDKTGTLTHGELEVVSVATFGEYSQQGMMRVVGGLEQHSEHPVAHAIGRYLKLQQIDPAYVRNVTTRPGFGLVGECDGRRLVVGTRSLMESEQVSFGPSLHQGQKEMDQGRTVVYVAIDSQVMGMLSLSDRLRSEAKDIVSYLKADGHHVLMLTGDNRRTAEGVAKTLGVENFEAEILPGQKQMAVETTRKVGYSVAMVGDGVNDAPALAAADVGIAIGAGADVAMESADVVLVRSDLMDLRKLFLLSRESLRIIRQNLFWALFYNVIAIPVAAGLLYPWFGLVLSPMIAALAMSLSSVFVVTNSLRLGRLEL